MCPIKIFLLVLLVILIFYLFHKLLKDNNLYQYGYTVYLEGTSSVVIGSIKEIDKYLEPIDGLAYTDSEYQQIIKNKTVNLVIFSSLNVYS